MKARHVILIGMAVIALIAILAQGSPLKAPMQIVALAVFGVWSNVLIQRTKTR